MSLRDFQPRLDLYAAKQRQAAAREGMKALKSEIERTLRPIIGDARTPDGLLVWDAVGQYVDLLFSDYEAHGHLAMDAGTVIDQLQSAVSAALIDAEPDSSDPEAVVRWMLRWEETCDALQRWKDDSLQAETSRNLILALLPSLLRVVSRVWRELADATDAVTRAVRTMGAATSTGPPVYTYRCSDAEQGATLSRFAAQA